jgi:nicotinamidase-related amidase
MSFEPEASILLIVDTQERLMPAIAGSELVLANIRRLAEVARLLDVPVLGTEQNPEGLGPNASLIKALTQRTLAKSYFDATKEPHWAGFLPHGRSDIVVAGCEAHVCVLQTVMGLCRSGRAVRLVRDAVGSRTPENRNAALHRAERHGAELVTTEMVVFEWLATCEHPRFREALRQIK